MADEAGIIELPISVDPGRYVVKYVSHETLIMRDSIPKLAVYFAIVEGPFAGVEIPRYYNVKRLNGPPREFGGFLAGRNSHFTRDYLTLLGRPQRSDRVSPAHLKGKRLLCGIRYTDKDWNRNDLHQNCQYSVIGELIEILADEDSDDL